MKSKFSIRLKELRDERGLTQEELSAKTGVSFPTISRYEKGHRDEPKLSILKALANFFNVSIDYLVGDSDTKDREFTPTEISKIFLSLEDDSKKILMDLAKNLYRKDGKA